MTSGYYIVSKAFSQPYYKYKGDALRLINQTARTVDEIVISNRNNPDILKKITTFRDSDGNIIERIFDYSDKIYKNRIYTRQDNIIGENEYVISTDVKEYTLPKILKNAYKQLVSEGRSRTCLWTPVKFYTNHFSENIETGEKVLTKTLRKNILKPQKEVHSFIEFPHITKEKDKKGTKKILEFIVNASDGHKINPKKLRESNVRLPQNDPFLGIRALDIEDSKKALAKKFLSERKLKNKMITINPQYLPETSDEELLKGLFDPNDGSLNFVKSYKFKSKSDVCATARHETEHGWQFYLHARNTKGGATKWEEKIYKTFGDLPQKLEQEAQKYTTSIQNYVSSGENLEKYRQNYIEELAFKEGLLARKKYDAQRAEIKKLFPHIPSELL